MICRILLSIFQQKYKIFAEYRKYLQTVNYILCINARGGRDFQLEHHYMRGLETMQMQVALSLSVMLAMACTWTPERVSRSA